MSTMIRFFDSFSKFRKKPGTLTPAIEKPDFIRELGPIDIQPIERAIRNMHQSEVAMSLRTPTKSVG